jgi:hypothetical protein
MVGTPDCTGDYWGCHHLAVEEWYRSQLRAPTTSITGQTGVKNPDRFSPRHDYRSVTFDSTSVDVDSSLRVFNWIDSTPNLGSDPSCCLYFSKNLDLTPVFYAKKWRHKAAI